MMQESPSRMNMYEHIWRLMKIS